MSRTEDSMYLTQSGRYGSGSAAPDATTTVKGIVKQATFVADVAALTSANATGGDAPTEAEYNALRADVVAIRTTLAAIHTALKAAANKPMATS